MKKRKKLKLFVWENVLVERTDGVMFALARDVKHARKVILKKCDYVGKDLDSKPRLVRAAEGFAVWGGG